MDVRFLSLPEFHRVYFFRLITLAMFLVIGLVVLWKLPSTPPAQLALIGGFLALLYGRFAVEWRWLRRCMCASLHGDELILSTEREQRQVPLHSVSQVESRRSLFMVRRYRSWSEHLAFVRLTLSDGERIQVLVESAVLEFPPGRHSLAALRAAVMAAKVRRQHIG